VSGDAGYGRSMPDGRPPIAGPPPPPGRSDGDPDAAARPAERQVVDGFRALLAPPPPPDVPGLEIACLYQPAAPMSAGESGDAVVADIGGDFVDFFGGPRLSHAAVIMGDISGKGLQAALQAIAAKYMLRGLVSSERWPLPPGSLLMDATNALLTLLGDDPGRFVTLAIVSVGGRDGLVAVSLAGHPAPAVIRADRIERPLQFLMPAIGVTSDAELQALPSEEVRLDPGDALLLFTDGLSDAHTSAGDYYEETRLEAALEELRGMPAAQLLERLLADVTAFTGHPPSDDVALVLIRRLVDPRGPAARSRRVAAQPAPPDRPPYSPGLHRDRPSDIDQSPTVPGHSSRYGRSDYEQLQRREDA